MFGWSGDGCCWWAVAGGWCFGLAACVFVVCLLCGAVSCRVDRVVARYLLLLGGHLSLVVDCLSLCCALLFCVFWVVLCGVCGCVCWGRRGRRCVHRTHPGVYVRNALRVYQHHAHMFLTCGLGAGTHGGVLNAHTEVFSVSRHTPQPHNQNNKHDTQHNTTNQWCCIAVFLVGEVICLVTSFNDRDLDLLNRVKCDSFLITFQRDHSRTHP